MRYKQKFSKAYFDVLINWLNKQISEGVIEMPASELCLAQRKSQYIIENIHEYIFGYHRQLDTIRRKIAEQD